MDILEQSLFSHEDGFLHIEGRKVNFDILHELPLVIHLKNVIPEDLCDSIIKDSYDRLEKSKISLGSQENIRTSSSMFFDKSENNNIKRLEEIASEIMCIPTEFAEGIQILNYKPGQEFKPHFDFFKDSNPSSENNRISTLIFYLNNPGEGGETTFPELGISVPAKKCNAVYFEYFYNDAKLNNLTLHSGSPLIKGEKWAATQWMRRKKIN